MLNNHSVFSKIGKLNSSNIHSLINNIYWILSKTWRINRRLMICVLLVSLIMALMPAAFAVVIRGLVNEVASILQLPPHSINGLMFWLVLGMGVTLVETVGNFTKKYLSHRLHDELNLSITADILNHAATLDVSYFEDPRFQDMMERAQQRTAERFSQFVTNMLTVMTNLIQISTLTMILFAIEPLVTFVLLFIAIPYLIFQWRLAQSRFSKDHHRAKKQRWTRYFVRQLIHHDSVPEVKLLDLAPLLIRKFKSLMTEFRDQDKRLYRRDLLGNALFATLSVIAFYATFVRVAIRASNGVLSLGDVAIYGGATARLRYSVESAVLSITIAMEQTLHISNLLAFLDLKPNIAKTTGRIPNSGRGDIQLSGVTFTYPGTHQPAISGISLHIHPGETVALVGENGAGKSTLVKLIARLYDPNDGVVFFDETDVRQLDVEFLYHQISFVFQSFGRYEASVGENIAYGDWRHMVEHPDRVEKVARLAGVHDMINAMPERYDTQIGRMFGQYNPSGGEWQRIAIARAFARGASVLILDEPTSNLDAKAEYQLFSRFHELSKGRTTILISHRFATVSMADRIVVLDDGRIIEWGTHEGLLSKQGHYARLFHLHRQQMNFSETTTVPSN